MTARPTPLAGSPGSRRSQPLDGRPDWVAVSLVDTGEIATAGLQVSEIVRALADSEIPVLAFELEGTRLSDAFLAMTGEG